MRFKLTALAAYMALSVPAHAVNLELGFGETHYIKQTNGVWWQEGFPYWMDTQDQSLSLGVSWKPNNVRYRAEFLVLGKHFVNGLATSDSTYNPYFVTHCSPDCGLVVFQGRGSVSGLVLSASRDVYGPVYVEAGLYANIKKWQVTVTRPDGTFLAEMQRKYQIDFGPMVGLGLRYNGLDVGIQYIYLDDSAEGDPMTPMMTGAYRGYIKVFF